MAPIDNPPIDVRDRWRFSLKQLFVATTTIALALGALQSPLPWELSVAIASSVTSFWFGVAIVIFATGPLYAKSRVIQWIGAIFVLIGLAFAVGGAMIFLVLLTFLLACILMLLLYATGM